MSKIEMIIVPICVHDRMFEPCKLQCFLPIKWWPKVALWNLAKSLK